MSVHVGICNVFVIYNKSLILLASSGDKHFLINYSLHLCNIKFLCESLFLPSMQTVCFLFYGLKDK